MFATCGELGLFSFQEKWLALCAETVKPPQCIWHLAGTALTVPSTLLPAQLNSKYIHFTWERKTEPASPFQRPFHGQLHGSCKQLKTQVTKITKILNHAELAAAHVFCVSGVLGATNRTTAKPVCISFALDRLGQNADVRRQIN